MHEVRRAIIFGTQKHIRSLFSGQLTRKGFIVDSCQSIDELRRSVSSGFPEFIAVDDLSGDISRATFIDQLKDLGWDSSTTEIVFLSDHRGANRSGTPPTAFATVPITGWVSRLKNGLRK